MSWFDSLREGVVHLAGSVARSYGVELAEDEVTLEYQCVFRTEWDAEVRAVEQAFGEEADLEGFSVTNALTDGGPVSPTGTAPLGAFDGAVSR